MGGLGLKNLGLWNIAVLGNHVWNVAAKKDLLWGKWVSGVYLKEVDFWSYMPKDTDSWYWMKVLEIRDHLARGFL